jgi:hypothetical protein
VLTLKALRSPHAFGAVLAVAVAIAALGFWVGPVRWVMYARGNGMPDTETLRLCSHLAAAWVVVFVLSVPPFRARALWFLLSAPFALYWPLMFGFLRGAWFW